MKSSNRTWCGYSVRRLTSALIISSTGRTLPRPSSTGVLQGRMVDLGPKDHHTTRTVRLFRSDDTAIVINSRVRRYILSVLLHRIFVFRCNLALLRFTVTLTLISLPLLCARLLAFHQRRRPPPLLAPSPEALVLSTFPIAWFYGFLYYTDVPSLVSVLLTVILATQHRHLSAALLGVISCLFRQTNIVWVMYAFATSQLMRMRFRRGNMLLHDPPALSASPGE
ncbi:DIE2/ALG10 family-domain-containing protein [Boletus reticuloceps]|uniref:Dol-P-Glc:Glc(2)Man(9)GlcNAc(2)-PP-Dol alpha-1,2-glucosyltransferase n=1 Tax=Boletus reticuloceps TaxID=495285 RepID=A0A8I2YH03_9AGAM|nr:DIE2/ALG10 family-domain-containing protein [Boletus reticuloceps]